MPLRNQRNNFRKQSFSKYDQAALKNGLFKNGNDGLIPKSSNLKSVGNLGKNLGNSVLFSAAGTLGAIVTSIAAQKMMEKSQRKQEMKIQNMRNNSQLPNDSPSNLQTTNEIGSGRTKRWHRKHIINVKKGGDFFSTGSKIFKTIGVPLNAVRNFLGSGRKKKSLKKGSGVKEFFNDMGSALGGNTYNQIRDIWASGRKYKYKKRKGGALDNVTTPTSSGPLA